MEDSITVDGVFAPCKISISIDGRDCGEEIGEQLAEYLVLAGRLDELRHNGGPLERFFDYYTPYHPGRRCGVHALKTFHATDD
jgi:hypothetical protein